MKDPNLLAWSMRELALQKSEEKVEPLIVVEQIYTPSEQQKKLYFNAGRWAGGARDWVARKAYEEVMGNEGVTN